MLEIFKDIKGYEGYYKVSNLGYFNDEFEASSAYNNFIQNL